MLALPRHDARTAALDDLAYRRLALVQRARHERVAFGGRMLDEPDRMQRTLPVQRLLCSRHDGPRSSAFMHRHGIGHVRRDDIARGAAGLVRDAATQPPGPGWRF